MSLSNVFKKLKSFKVMVLGDFLLDQYTTGKIKRISPEAPVPIMEVLKYDTRPGGAGNVALNLATLGAEVTCVGRVGADDEGKELEALLTRANMDLQLLLVEPGYPTPVKNRLIAESQQLMRIDREVITPLSPPLEKMLFKELDENIARVDVIAISDYGKGFLTESLIQYVIQQSKQQNVPVIVDPKGTDFRKYRGATILKPNLSEAYAAAKKTHDVSLGEVVDQLFEVAEPENLLITRSEAGISFFSNTGTRLDVPVVSKEVTDVTGAGDTVLAALCLGIANGLDLSKTLHICNMAAGIAIERLGCYQVTLTDIAEKLLQIDSQSKIIDGHENHLLEVILKENSYNLFAFSGTHFPVIQILKGLQKQAKLSSSKTIVYFPEIEDETLHFLSNIEEIDGVILQEKSLANLLKKAPPEEIFVWEKNHFAKKLLESLFNNRSTKTDIALVKNN